MEVMALSKRMLLQYPMPFLTMSHAFSPSIKIGVLGLNKIGNLQYAKSQSIIQIRKAMLVPSDHIKSVFPMRFQSHYLISAMCSESQNVGPLSEFQSRKENIHQKKSHSMVHMVIHSTRKLARVLIKFLSALFLVAIATVVGTPTFLSTKAGLAAAVFLTNQAITGKLSIEKVSLGYTKPVHLKGLALQNTDGEVVLSIPEFYTKASLWALIKGKQGFGDSKVTSPYIDLKDDHHTGLSRLGLALIPAHKLSRLKGQPRHPKKVRVEPGQIVKLVAKVKAASGDLDVIDAHLSVPGDLAAVLGNQLFFDVLVDSWALDVSEELNQLASRNRGHSPVQAMLWSENIHAEASGFFIRKIKRVELIKPLRIEMDLTPAVAHLYLSRMNPLLGDIVGPAVKDEDMPDVILQVLPRDMMFPAHQHKIRIEPMEVVLARGPIVDGVLSLLSKGDIVKGSREIKLQTSKIEADLELDNWLKCFRFDLLIAEKVHLATWGQANLVDDTIQMILAIPSTTLKGLLGFTKLPLDYYLQIPIKGSVDQPQIDFSHAGSNIAQLALYQRGGPFMEQIIRYLSVPGERVPEPIYPFPWANSQNNA